MAVFARLLAGLSKSTVLEADAWNHTFDVVCSLMVVLALASAKMGWGAVDGWTAIGVALFILYTGIAYAREAIDILLGTTPDSSEVRAIHDAVAAVEGVMGAHEIMVHQYGDVKMVSFHVEVDAGMSVVQAHAIGERAEEAVESKLLWRAVAHVDPVDRSHPLFKELNEALRDHVAADAALVDMHDLRAEGATPPYRISFDLVTDMETDRRDYDAICKQTVSVILEMFPRQVGLVKVGVEAAVESAPVVRRIFDVSTDISNT